MGQVTRRLSKAYIMAPVITYPCLSSETIYTSEFFRFITDILYNQKRLILLLFRDAFCLYEEPKKRLFSKEKTFKACVRDKQSS